MKVKAYDLYYMSTERMEIFVLLKVKIVNYIHFHKILNAELVN